MRRLPISRFPDFPIASADLIVALGSGLQVIESFDDENPRMTQPPRCRNARVSHARQRDAICSACVTSATRRPTASSSGSHRGCCGLGQNFLGAARLPRLVQLFIQRLSMMTGERVALTRRTDHWIARQQLDSTLGGVALPLVTFMANAKRR